jgi:dipeptidyl aminopeptidase/acylaminoacyl peptidase
MASVWIIVVLLASCSPPSVQTAAPPLLAETATEAPTATLTPAPTPSPTPLNSLSISYLRQRSYPGSDITIEQTLTPGSNYSRYIVSYRSDDLKIYALMTVPKTPKPKSGFPVIIFNHGYIPPAQYRTTERYVAYVDGFARNGYVVFKSDYRGHGNSEGEADGGYGNADYTSDVLNALASLKKYPEADPQRIGMWGHSMGGLVTLRAMVISKDIRAGVIWSGVVASYPDLMEHWRRAPWVPTAVVPESARHWRSDLTQQYGTPEQNPAFWGSISPTSYLSDLSGPLQLHHSTTDPEVPYEFSQTLRDQVQAAGKTVEFYSYPGDDHNLSKHLALALQRSVAFFDKYVKARQP